MGGAVLVPGNRSAEACGLEPERIGERREVRAIDLLGNPEQLGVPI